MKLAYFPGCALRDKAKDFDCSTRAVAQALGIELEELKDWTCCGATFSQASDYFMGLVAPIRILTEARAQGSQRLLTQCSFCYNTLKRANYAIVHNEEQRTKVCNFLEEEYAGEVRVVHLLEVVRDGIGTEQLRKRVNRPLTGLQVAPYYGCVLLRPYREILLDDPEEPTVLEQILEAIGCQVVDFPRKTECCGSYLVATHYPIAASCSEGILRSASNAGVHALVTSCPVCHYNLDRRQAELLRGDGDFAQMAVLYFTQLLAIALGVPAAIGSEYRALHKTDPKPVLEKLGLAAESA